MGLRREIAELEGRLDPTANRGLIDELATVRRGLKNAPSFELPNVRIGFACKQRWEDMVGDDRVRACAGCDRPVFNLSEMTREDAARVLATRGLTPCVRFYRRPDGTVMTKDCPTGERREQRRLAVVASSVAAGTMLVAPSARAEPPPDGTTEPIEVPGEVIKVEGVRPQPELFEVTMGVTTVEHEMGELIEVAQERPRLALALWGRLGGGFATTRPNIFARALTPPAIDTTSAFEAAISAETTLGLTHDGNLRLGAWAELRTSSDPVIGGELVVEGLPPHPYDSRIGGTGSVVLRAGGNGHVVTGALGFGYTGSWFGTPWVHWAEHVVGARVITSMNRSLDDPRDWSVTFGLEVELIGAVQAAVKLAKD